MEFYRSTGRIVRAFALLWTLAAAASGMAREGRAGPEWMDREGFRAVEKLRRGVNLGNAWEAPPGTWGDRTYSAADFRAIKSAGFDHVRVPVAWHHHQAEAPPHALGPAILREIDVLVARARKERLAVVLTWHHFDRLTTSPGADEIAQWHAGWAQIAGHFRDAPAEALVFELLNEPRDAATTERMNGLYPALIAAVRAIDPRRTLLVSPGDWGSLKALPGLRLPRDLTNVIATGHCYEPFLFTHQGAGWTEGLTRTKGIVYPGPPARSVQPAPDAPAWVARWVRDHNRLPAGSNPSGSSAFAGLVEAAAEWGRREGRAVYVGEFGATIWADEASRVAYARAMREHLDKNGLGWAWWDWKANFAVATEVDGSPRVNEALRAALFPGRLTTGRAGHRRGPRGRG